MESDAHVNGFIHKSFTGFHVNITSWSECPYYHTVNSETPAHGDVGAHAFHLIGSIYEIASSRTYEHVHPYASYIFCGGYEP